MTQVKKINQVSNIVTVTENYVQETESQQASRLTKHEVVSGVSVHVLLVQVRREEFDVATAAVNFLLVLHGELDDERFALVVEVSKT